MLTVAELLESPETLERLRDIGVNIVQGFGISPPLPLRHAG